jgi:hypothetical protein
MKLRVMERVNPGKMVVVSFRVWKMMATLETSVFSLGIWGQLGILLNKINNGYLMIPKVVHYKP